MGDDQPVNLRVDSGYVPVSWEAVILAGGRAERLGGYDKATLVAPDGRTSLDLVLEACSGALRRVVVGPQPDDLSGTLTASGLRGSRGGGEPAVIWTREQPVFSGPARAICAGLAALAAAPAQTRMHRLLASRATLWGCDGSAGGAKADWTSVERRPTSQRASTGSRSSHGSVHSGQTSAGAGEVIPAMPDLSLEPDSFPDLADSRAAGPHDEAAMWVAVVACDMPHVAQALPILLQAAAQAGPHVDGVVAEADGHFQWLCALYRKTALTSACAQLAAGGSSESVGRLVGGLTLAGQPVPGSSVQDIDTETDMRTFGFRPTSGDSPAT
ncbi:MAG: NTP transferase domain-containing protein [Propionibacteriaceae bacterium]|nr:NTP transferase domain-containing protein [Propionibacteriaceae bacterium]